ncbi:ankyrin repeat domain-containing protein [Endozoicomonas elysicola]|uniref:Uncharacterized protein n=1 Tax=Endozoicomonas elysicola TaxID=305900 RepID=A0A081K880_9GAMM|nr:ankyrin repeat domain-containing protein [Endozoicomonas elysicola]KEI70356.1 hypothetical protein GV64_06105 [Endozoicomonas elysicola]
MDGCISRGYHCYIPDFGQVGLPCQGSIAAGPSTSVSSLKETSNSPELPDRKLSDREVSVADIPDDTEIVLNRLKHRKLELLDRKANVQNDRNDQEIDAWIREIEQCSCDYDQSENEFERLVENLTDLAKHKDFEDLNLLDAKEGICYALAFSHIQSVLTGAQKEFAEALQLLSRSSTVGWLYRGTVYNSLVEPINHSFNDYREYVSLKAGQPVPEGKSLFFDLFAKDHPDSFKYMQILARLNSLSVYQVPDKTFLRTSLKSPDGVKASTVLHPWVMKDAPADQPPFQATREWVMTVTPDGLEGILGCLSTGTYLLLIDEHALSIDIADEAITVFNQNARLYFLQAKRNEHQSLKMLAKKLHHCLSGSVVETDDLTPVPFSIQRIDQQSDDGEEQEQDQKLKDILKKHGSHVTSWSLGNKARIALELAICADNLESVQSFLPGRSLDKEPDQGEPFLMMALNSGAGVDVVKTLMDAGANRDKNREYWEMLRGQKAGTRPGGRRRLVHRPREGTRDFRRDLLISAIEGNNLETLRWITSGEFKFLPAGIIRDNSLLKEALEIDSMNAARVLIQLGMPDRFGHPDSEELIGIAISKGAHDIVDSLLAKCGWPSSRSDLLKMVITHPNGDLYGEMLSVLLKYLPKGEINLAPSGKSALYHAASAQNFNTIQKLFEYGATINPEGEPPLIAAIETGSLSLVEFLLDKGSSPNQSRSDEKHPLQCAIEGAIKSQKLDIVDLLLNRGAVLSYDNFEKAVDVGNLSLVKFLLSKRKGGGLGTIPASLIKVAICKKHFKVAEFLVKGGASLDSDDGAVALDISVSYGYPEMVELLLVNGASTDKVDYSGNSILHTAVEIGRDDIVSIILKYCQPNTVSSVLNRKNIEGLNPLDIAIKKNRTKEYCNIIGALKECGFEASKTSRPKNRSAQPRTGRRSRRGGFDIS